LEYIKIDSSEATRDIREKARTQLARRRILRCLRRYLESRYCSVLIPIPERACATKLSIASVNSLLRPPLPVLRNSEIHLIKFLPLSRAPVARFKIPREEEPRGFERENTTALAFSLMPQFYIPRPTCAVPDPAKRRRKYLFFAISQKRLTNFEKSSTRHVERV